MVLPSFCAFPTSFSGVRIGHSTQRRPAGPGGFRRGAVRAGPRHRFPMGGHRLGVDGGRAWRGRTLASWAAPGLFWPLLHPRMAGGGTGHRHSFPGPSGPPGGLRGGQEYRRRDAGRTDQRRAYSPAWVRAKAPRPVSELGTALSAAQLGPGVSGGGRRR